MAPELISRASMLEFDAHELLKTIQNAPSECRFKTNATVARVIATLEGLPTRLPRPFAEAERNLWRKKRVRVPFTHPQAQSDASLAVGFAKPSAIQVICNGSLLKRCEDSDAQGHDIIVVMPSDLFQDGDHLDYRYFTKRAFYLGCIASGVSQIEGVCGAAFAFLNDNPLQPTIVLDLGPSVPSRVRIVSIMDRAVFPRSAGYPWKRCIRAEGSTRPKHAWLSVEASVYHSTLNYERFLLDHYHSGMSFEESPCLMQTSRLMVLWLRQRGFGTGFTAGGLGDIEATAILALLCRSQDIQNSKGRLARLRGHEPVRLFRSLLRFFIVTDLIEEPVTVNADAEALDSLKGGCGPTFLDGQLGLNLLFKMSSASYKQLQFEARTTLDVFAHPALNSMSLMFVKKNDYPWLKFDHWLRLRIPRVGTDSMLPNDIRLGDAAVCERVLSCLAPALQDRVALVYLRSLPYRSWRLSSPTPAPKDFDMSIGLVSQPGKADKYVNRGPLAGDSAADDYRQFWGPKAELRRFHDGSIHESVSWPDDTKESPTQQIISYVVSRHIHPAAKVVPALVEPEVDIAPDNTSASGRKIFAELGRLISELTELPLKVEQTQESTSDDLCATPITYCAESRQFQEPLVEATIRLEASSRWPNNLLALQRTKAAFLLKLGEVLTLKDHQIRSKLGIDRATARWLDSPFLDIQLGSVAVRYRIHQEKEMELLNHVLGSPSISPELRRTVAAAISSHRRTHVAGPAHVQAVHTLASQFPALSTSVKLFSRWCASHLLSNHLWPELQECLVAHVFTCPYPYAVPASPRTGFFRTLAMIAEWNWQDDPLLIRLSTTLKNSEIEAMRLRFEAWRKIDPSMNRVTLFVGSSLDPGGVMWTEGLIQPVVASRLRALAKASYVKITGQKLDPRASVLFVTPLAQYDFVIHLRTANLQAPRYSSSSSRSQLQSPRVGSVTKPVANTVRNLLRELNVWYHDLCVFFYGEGGPVIGGLWCPQNGPKQWRVNLGLSTVLVAGGHAPSNSTVTSKTQVIINRGAILSEIARLGGDLVSSVEERSPPADST